MFLYILNCLLYEKYYIRRLRCQKGGVSLLDKIELLMGPPLLLKKGMHSKHSDMLLECFFFVSCKNVGLVLTYHFP